MAKPKRPSPAYIKPKKLHELVNQQLQDFIEENARLVQENQELKENLLLLEKKPSQRNNETQTEEEIGEDSAEIVPPTPAPTLIPEPDEAASDAVPVAPPTDATAEGKKNEPSECDPDEQQNINEGFIKELQEEVGDAILKIIEQKANVVKVNVENVKLKWGIPQYVSELMNNMFTPTYIKTHKMTSQEAKRGISKKKPMDPQHLKVLLRIICKAWEHVPGYTKNSVTAVARTQIGKVFNRRRL